MTFLILFPARLPAKIPWTLLYKLDTKYEKEGGGGKVRETLGEEGWNGVAHHGRENRHDNQSGEGGGEDEKSWVSHSHESSNEECLVSDLGKDDHGEGEDEGVERLDGTVVGIVER